MFKSTHSLRINKDRLCISDFHPNDQKKHWFIRLWGFFFSKEPLSSSYVIPIIQDDYVIRYNRNEISIGPMPYENGIEMIFEEEIEIKGELLSIFSTLPSEYGKRMALAMMEGEDALVFDDDQGIIYSNTHLPGGWIVRVKPGIYRIYQGKKNMRYISIMKK